MTKKEAERAGRGGCWEAAGGPGRWLLPVHEHSKCTWNVDAIQSSKDEIKTKEKQQKERGATRDYERDEVDQRKTEIPGCTRVEVPGGATLCILKDERASRERSFRQTEGMCGRGARRCGGGGMEGARGAGTQGCRGIRHLVFGRITQGRATILRSPSLC